MEREVVSGQKRYFSPDRRVLFVGCLGDDKERFYVVYEDGAGVRRRYLNRQLPSCKTQDEMQVFLDIFARTFGLVGADEKFSRPDALKI